MFFIFGRLILIKRNLLDLTFWGLLVRREFVKALEITDIELVKLVKTANLIRIEGIGEREVEMLEAVGVDTVKELARRNATNLNKKLETYGEANEVSIPSEEDVAKWIKQAKSLD